MTNIYWFGQTIDITQLQIRYVNVCDSVAALKCMIIVLLLTKQSNHMPSSKKPIKDTFIQNHKLVS